MAQVQALLSFTTAAFLAALLVELGSHGALPPTTLTGLLSPPNYASFPGAFTTSFCMLVAV